MHRRKLVECKLQGNPDNVPRQFISMKHTDTGQIIIEELQTPQVAEEEIIQPVMKNDSEIHTYQTDEQGNIILQVPEQSLMSSYDISELQAGEQMVQIANTLSDVTSEDQLLQFANTVSNMLQEKDTSTAQTSTAYSINTSKVGDSIELTEISHGGLKSNKNIIKLPLKMNKTQKTENEVQNQDLVQETHPVMLKDLGSNECIQIINHNNITTSSASQIDAESVQATDVVLSEEEVAALTSSGQEVVIDGLPADFQNYQNLRTEILEDGTIQLYVLDDGKGTQQKEQNELEYYVSESASEKVESGMQTSLMSITAKKYRDVATQITCYPKFSRQGLFDVSTQVTNKDIRTPLRVGSIKNLPNGTTVIQNSIKTQNESTVVLNAGDSSELIFHKCNICGKIYKNKVNWTNHIKCHAKETVYLCGHCGKIYQRSGITSHLRTHSELRNIAVFENLPSEMKRKNHKDVAGFVFPPQEPALIELEIADVTTEADSITFPEPAVIPAEPEPEPDLTEVFTENDIPAKVDMEVEAEAEIQEGTKTKYIYKCNVCGKEYNNKSNCHRHLKSHTTDKNFKCGYCGKAFTHRYEVRMHCRTHTGEKPFKCPICTRGFNESGNLRRHMKIHTADDSPYKCGVCFKGFDNTHRLNAHTKVHTGNIEKGKLEVMEADIIEHMEIVQDSIENEEEIVMMEEGGIKIIEHKYFGKLKKFIFVNKICVI
ncbi:hypothetical protein KUTeg_019037 [Tegillarca granosa]|uniref:C2H2-type domain-containing protein n=1 Tax=Tegillarca granosa TaxID=220873 RepID=A0ABQ9EDZ4_TEGGR|nr:hypothetical protein KUTeg_019037 [Tegillarca granosa]